MPIALPLILQLLEAALALADVGSQVYSFLTQVTARLNAAQASGADLTDADWAVIDAAAASNLIRLKGYGSLIAALLQTPSAAPAPSQAQ